MPLSSQPSSRAATLAAVVLVVAALYFARAVLIPFALALLLSFLLTPLVIRLQRWGLKRIPAVISVVTVAFIICGVAGALVTTQLVDLVRDLPDYQQNIHTKIQAFKAPQGGTLDRMLKMLSELNRDLSLPSPRPDVSPAEPAPSVSTPQPDAAESKPVPVEVRAPAPNALAILRGLMGSVLGPMASASVVVVFVIFMLLQREDLRDRFIRLIGARQLTATTRALDEAAAGVSRTLYMQLVINACFGTAVGVGLFFIGVPNAFLWGFLATFLRFIPYAGPTLAAILPTAVAFAVDPGWIKPLLTIALFAVLELITNNVLEPWLYGASGGIAPMGILVAAVFWTWLWGPIGLLLATPLTVCLAVLGRHVPHLEFLNVMLSDQPVLGPAPRFYQRLLATDQEEATALAEDFLKEKPLEELYDAVVIPALSLAEQDRRRGALDETHEQYVFQTMRDLIEELAEEKEDSKIAATGTEAKEHLDPETELFTTSQLTVLCVPAKDEADELAGLMLAQLLSRHGVQTTVLPAKTLAHDVLERVRGHSASILCVSAVAPFGLIAARHLCRRLRREFPERKIVAGLWNVPAGEKDLQNRLAASTADNMVSSLTQAVEQILPLANPLVTDAMQPAPIPPDEEERLAELKRLNLLDTKSEEVFDSVTRELAEMFHVPISLLSLIDTDRQFWKSQVGLPADQAAARQSPRATSICGHVVAANEMIVINDVRTDKRFANNPILRERGIRFYAGAPVRTAKGLAIGSLCIIDTVPRRLSARDQALLRMMAGQVAREVQARGKSDTKASN
jgi:predicted PurR-regulated permease PerM